MSEQVTMHNHCLYVGGCWWYEGKSVRFDPESGHRLNADGTVTEMVPAVTFANDNAGPVPCDFCGDPHSTTQCLPDLRYPEPPEGAWIGRWGHPLTGNVCRKCAIDQMAKASGGSLVPVVTNEAVRETRLMVGLLCAQREDDAPNNEECEAVEWLMAGGLVDRNYGLTDAGRIILSALSVACATIATRYKATRYKRDPIGAYWPTEQGAAALAHAQEQAAKGGE